MPFDPPDHDTWWNDPSIDPFFNARSTAPNPFASAPAPFSAESLGAMAWHPPIFPGDWSNPVSSNFPGPTWLQQPNPTAPPASGPDLTTAPGWPFPQSLFASLVQ